MKTVRETIYFDFSSDITSAINELTNAREKAITAGMIENTGCVEINDDEGKFEFSRYETEKERIRREYFESAALKKVTDAKKVKEDKDRAEYERLKAKFEGVK